jgi:hypothetical protein
MYQCFIEVDLTVCLFYCLLDLSFNETVEIIVNNCKCCDSSMLVMYDVQAYMLFLLK